MHAADAFKKPLTLKEALSADADFSINRSLRVTSSLARSRHSQAPCGVYDMKSFYDLPMTAVFRTDTADNACIFHTFKSFLDRFSRQLRISNEIRNGH